MQRRSRPRARPDQRIERTLSRQGARLLAGVDEAGRGPIAGPVVAAAVMLDPRDVPDGLDDSKCLSPAERERLFTAINAHALVAIASVDARAIERMNVRAAALHAMAEALRALPAVPDAALIDGRDLPPTPVRSLSFIGGDGRSVSIAAASIMAKVTRDRMMQRADALYPQYGFARHKGYPTADHLRTLARFGPCDLHRRSFAPVRSVVEGKFG